MAFRAGYEARGVRAGRRAPRVPAAVVRGARCFDAESVLGRVAGVGACTAANIPDRCSSASLQASRRSSSAALRSDPRLRPAHRLRRWSHPETRTRGRRHVRCTQHELHSRAEVLLYNIFIEALAQFLDLALLRGIYLIATNEAFLLRDVPDLSHPGDVGGLDNVQSLVEVRTGRLLPRYPQCDVATSA